ILRYPRRGTPHLAHLPLTALGFPIAQVVAILILLLKSIVSKGTQPNYIADRRVRANAPELRRTMAICFGKKEPSDRRSPSPNKKESRKQENGHVTSFFPQFSRAGFL